MIEVKIPCDPIFKQSNFKAEINLGRPEDTAKRWRDVWSAGQGAGEVRAVEPLSKIVDELAKDYAAAAVA